MKTQVTVENLFSMCGVDWKKLSPGDWVDVSDKEVFVSSYNEEKKNVEKKKVLKLVRKQNSHVLSVQTKTGEELFKASPAHKVFASVDGENFKWMDLNSLLSYSDVQLKDNELNTVSVCLKDYGASYPILDFEVEGNHNYFANGILSHNTTTGGNALKFYASIRFTIRRKENVTGVNSDDIIGIVSTLKSIKNKVAPPFKTCELKLIFGKGYQVEEEYVTAFVKRSLITKTSSWYSWTYKDLNGKECAGKEQGLDNVIGWFKDHPVVFEQMKKKIQEMVAKENAVITEKEENEEEVIKQQTKLEKEAFADLHTDAPSGAADLASQALAAAEKPETSK